MTYASREKMGRKNNRKKRSEYLLDYMSILRENFEIATAITIIAVCLFMPRKTCLYEKYSVVG